MLAWIPENLATVFAEHGIRNRAQLSQAIPSVARAVIYRSLDDSWGGSPTTALLATISTTFSAPIGVLVTVKES